VSVYKAKDSPYYQYDFQLQGHRFHGSTKCKSKREAEAAERLERERAKRHLDQTTTVATSLRLDDVAGRYWNEVGQHHAGADNTWRQIGLVVDFLGKDKLLTEITGDDVARLVAWRRSHKRKDGSPISPYTVNDTTEQLKKLFTRAKAWGARFDREPVWRDHWLDEPQERVRELQDAESDRLDAAMRSDYEPSRNLKAKSFPKTPGTRDRIRRPRFHTAREHRRTKWGGPSRWRRSNPPSRTKAKWPSPSTTFGRSVRCSKRKTVAGLLGPLSSDLPGTA
jgi:hypothetical protein